MLDQLKRFAMQRLAEKMLGNALGGKETEEAAEEGANGLMETLTGALSGGGLSQITDLLGGSAEGGMEKSDLFNSVKGNLLKTLVAKGMPQAEAEQEAANVAPDLLSGLAEKFQSSSEEDSGFDLGSLAKLAGGNLDAGSILGAASKLFGK